MIPIINLTPHPIVFVDEDGNPNDTVDSHGVVRIEMENHRIGDVDGIPVFRSRPRKDAAIAAINQIEDAQNEIGGKAAVIVSRLVLDSLPVDPVLGSVYSPGEVLRDKDGTIIGCRTLIGRGDEL